MNDWPGDGSSHASICLVKLLLPLTSYWPFFELPTGIIITLQNTHIIYYRGWRRQFLEASITKSVDVFPFKSWNTWLGNSFPSFGFQSVLLKAGIQKSPAPVWMGAILVLAWAPAVSVDPRRWISPFNCFIWKMMETIILCSFWECQEYHVFKISLFVGAGTGAQTTNLYIVWGENDVKNFFKGEIKGDRKVGSKIGGNGVSCLF